MTDIKISSALTQGRQHEYLEAPPGMHIHHNSSNTTNTKMTTITDTMDMTTAISRTMVRRLKR